MKNFCLRFPDEQTAIAMMARFRVKSWRGERWSPASLTHALDVLGDVYKPTGQMTTVEDIETHVMQETNVMEKSQGWHCNLMIDELPKNLLQYVVTPATPKRVWA